MPLPPEMYQQYKEFSTRFRIDQAIAKMEGEKTISSQGEYSTGGAHAEALNRNKLAQRKKLAALVEDDNGIVVEMFAGRGNLTNAVWKAHSEQNILVEYNPETVEQFTSQITDPARTTIYTMSNIDFAKDTLSNIPADRITAIDFDAFGSAIPIITTTLDHFKPVRPLVVGVTDGIASNLVRVSRKKEVLHERLVELGYFPLPRDGLNMNLFMIKVMHKTMQLICKDRNLSCEIVNGTHNRKSTIYCGYIVKPL